MYVDVKCWSDDDDFNRNLDKDKINVHVGLLICIRTA